MRTGNVTMNGRSLFGITSPFGGTKQSGLGRRNGTDGFEEYLGSKPSAYPTETTTVDVQKEISDRLKVAALINRYARAVDSNDWGSLASAAELDR